MKKASVAMKRSRHAVTVASMMLLGLAGCSDAKPATGTPGVPAMQPPGPPETDLEKQVRTHAWWTEPVTSSKVNWLVSEVQSTRPGKTFIFDSRAFQNARMTTSDIREPVGIAEAGVPSPAWIHEHSQQSSRELTLSAILKSLDEAMERRQSGK